jgi:hypothetical protein
MYTDIIELKDAPINLAKPDNEFDVIERYGGQSDTFEKAYFALLEKDKED